MPAKTTPADPKPIGVKQLAEHLEIEPRALRAFLRRSKRGVGRGTRYEWKSLTDPEAKKVIAEWKAAQEKQAEAVPSSATNREDTRPGVASGLFVWNAHS